MRIILFWEEVRGMCCPGGCLVDSNLRDCNGANGRHLHSEVLHLTASHNGRDLIMKGAPGDLIVDDQLHGAHSYFLRSYFPKLKAPALHDTFELSYGTLDL